LRRQDTAASDATESVLRAQRERIDRIFGLESIRDIVLALDSDPSRWAVETAAALRKRSPLMLCVSFELIRRARSMSLADDLRLERDLMRNCFHLRPGAASEAVEGVRALAIDKDHKPRWSPSSLDQVTPEMVEAFFRSPWPAHAHPLRSLD
jgi:enoyl-CoA hydratase